MWEIKDKAFIIKTKEMDSAAVFYFSDFVCITANDWCKVNRVIWGMLAQADN